MLIMKRRLYTWFKHHGHAWPWKDCESRSCSGLYRSYCVGVKNRRSSQILENIRPKFKKKLHVNSGNHSSYTVRVVRYDSYSTSRTLCELAGPLYVWNSGSVKHTIMVIISGPKCIYVSWFQKTQLNPWPLDDVLDCCEYRNFGAFRVKWGYWSQVDRLI